MKYEEKPIILKNGANCILRSPGPDDAEAVLSLLKQTAGETGFISRYPEEVTMTVEAEREFLSEQQTNPKSLMICAAIDGEIIASAGMSCVQNNIKYLHRAVFGMAVRKEYWNLGIGTKILAELIIWAEAIGYEQIELEVLCENVRAVELYKKLGFEVYGTREKSFKFKDNTYASEFLMLKKL